MKHNLIPIIISLLIALIISNVTKSQVTNVIVETYYISDSNDATDSTGGHLEAGSKTYRVYIQLAKGCKLKQIFGNYYHPLKISSTEVFFNNIDRGVSFGKDINDRFLRDNTTALDSWLTLGLATKKHNGILKSEDTDGSIVGGKNNDGGSGNIPGGLLVNADTAAGIPVIQEDGLVVSDSLPTSWISSGITNAMTGADSTIFGSLKTGKEFISKNALLQCSGVKGPLPDNKILVAQLTTKGELSFELNIEIEQYLNGSYQNVFYVANGNPGKDTLLCPYLKYPLVCGCTDNKYLEFSLRYACNNPDSCRRLIRFGCMDTSACNYDPTANFNLQDLCCYPGKCNDRDLSVVCPDISAIDKGLNLYPNPAENEIEITFYVNQINSTEFLASIYDLYGRLINERKINASSGNNSLKINVDNLRNGLYFIKIAGKGNKVLTKTFLKN